MDAFVIGLLALVIVLIVLGVKKVDQGMEYTVECFGRYTRSLRPGLNFIVLVMDSIGQRVNMMERVMDVPSQEIITKDNAMVKVDGVVFFQAMDSAKASYEVNNLEHAILNLTMTNIRTVMGSMDLDELLSRRDEINTQLLSVVDDATTPWGVKVTRIEIKVAPPMDLVDAMARQMKAEREKQGAILKAEGEKEAAFREAEARERLAEAEARATLVVSQAIDKGDINAINYFVATKYVDALKEIGMADNQKLVFMPLEASGVISAIGGIGELAKEVYNKKSEG